MAERYIQPEWSKSPERRARRVVLTGCGMVTPLGNNVDTNWQRLVDGDIGAEPLDVQYKTDVKVAGRVRMDVAKELEPYNVLTPHFKQDLKKVNSPIHRAVQIELPPMCEALKQSGLLGEDGELTVDNRSRMGIIFATAVGGAPGILQDRDLLKKRNGTSPGSITRLDLSRVTSLPGWFFKGLHGPSWTVLAACAGSTISAINCYEQIYMGNADVMIGGGTDAFVDYPEMIKNFEALGEALSREEDPKKALRAYDENPTGTVAGEGTGVVVLESEEHALRRGANILALVGGYSVVNDGYHETEIEPNGYAFREAMITTLQELGGATEGTHQNLGHGGGTPDDRKEANGLIEGRRIMGRTEDFGLTSTKAQTTHTWGADGAVRIIFGSKALNEGILIPTINSQNPIGEFVIRELKRRKNFVTISNTGLGGITAMMGLLPYSLL